MVSAARHGDLRPLAADLSQGEPHHACRFPCRRPEANLTPPLRSSPRQSGSIHKFTLAYRKARPTYPAEGTIGVDLAVNRVAGSCQLHSDAEIALPPTTEFVEGSYSEVDPILPPVDRRPVTRPALISPSDRAGPTCIVCGVRIRRHIAPEAVALLKKESFLPVLSHHHPEASAPGGGGTEAQASRRRPLFQVVQR